MEISKPLNIFYEEPDPDRFFKYDRYPRRLIRRIIRGKQRPGGVMMVALNLMKGLDKIGVPYRFNDYRYIKNHPEEIACIIGKPQVLLDKKWRNPIIFGAGIYSHPIDNQDLLETYPNVKRVLVPGEWMRKMFEPYYGDKVFSWPVGLDTNQWKPMEGEKTSDFLIYYKIRWNHGLVQRQLVDPVLKVLDKSGLTYQFIRYGTYIHEELAEKIETSKGAIFLCEHETQGLAYQQILSTNTPILAWDSEGYWQDPYYYPERVKYSPVSSVPYWDDRCGVKFKGSNDFESALNSFIQKKEQKIFSPRQYILENLSLEKCAEAYVKIYQDIKSMNADKK